MSSRVTPAQVRLGPLLVETEIDLPEAEPAEDDRQPDVLVRRGPLDRPPAREGPPSVQVTGGCCRIDLPGLACLTIADGKEIRVAPDPGAMPTDVRALVYNSGIIAAYLQRGLLPLHLGAVETARGLVTFSGASGAGKSTTVALLAGRGHAVFSDDICVLQPTAADCLAYQHLRVMKLCPDVAGHLPGQAFHRERSLLHEKEFRAIRPVAGGRRIARVYVLDARPEPGLPAFTRLRGQEAIAAILATNFQPYLVRALGKVAEVFETLSRLMRDVAVYRVIRPRDLDEAPRFATALEHHFATS